MPQRSQATVAFGRELRVERRRAGLSQERLALEAGINRNTIGKIERGAMTPTLDLILRIAEQLEVDAAELVARAAAER